MEKRTAIVIGAGISGLAMARALAIRGFNVKVLERNGRAIGASIRNFGMIWPVGQPAGHLYERALRSKRIWKGICDEANLWYGEVGSLHVAHEEDEWEVIKELYESFHRDRPVALLTIPEIAHICPAAEPKGLIGGLYSRDEMIINALQAIETLPGYLTSKYGVEFLWNKCVSYISDRCVYIGTHESYDADQVFICSGTDFETLYPEEFARFSLTKCKLQMMRTAPQPDNWRMGTALCGGLSLIHYNSFNAAASLDKLKKRYTDEWKAYTDNGIHVMACQNESGQITIGDSHEYGLTHDPFDREAINTLILAYLKKIARFPEWHIAETWNGIYPKLTNGDTELYYSPEQGVHIVNGLGGTGMTMSFGYMEEVVEGL